MAQSAQCSQLRLLPADGASFSASCRLPRGVSRRWRLWPSFAAPPSHDRVLSSLPNALCRTLHSQQINSAMTEGRMKAQRDQFMTPTLTSESQSAARIRRKEVVRRKGGGARQQQRGRRRLMRRQRSQRVAAVFGASPLASHPLPPILSTLVPLP